MRRWLPYPVITLLLLAMWLLLNETAAIGHWLMGAALALAGALAYAQLQDPIGKARRIRAMAVLSWHVLLDIVRSNVAVARIVLYIGTRAASSGFLDIPLTLRNPVGLAVLACIITATPGTAWVRYDTARGILTLHILDLVDEAAWMDTIKRRYERRLLEIFE